MGAPLGAQDRHNWKGFGEALALAGHRQPPARAGTDGPCSAPRCSARGVQSPRCHPHLSTPGCSLSPLGGAGSGVHSQVTCSEAWTPSPGAPTGLCPLRKVVICTVTHRAHQGPNMAEMGLPTKAVGSHQPLANLSPRGHPPVLPAASLSHPSPLEDRLPTPTLSTF